MRIASGFFETLAMAAEDGGESRKVGERRAVLCVELEAYPEAKILTPEELAAIVIAQGGIQRAADRIGASYVFVWQNMAEIRR